MANGKGASGGGGRMDKEFAQLRAAIKELTTAFQSQASAKASRDKATSTQDKAYQKRLEAETDAMRQYDNILDKINTKTKESNAISTEQLTRTEQLKEEFEAHTKILRLAIQQQRLYDIGQGKAAAKLNESIRLTAKKVGVDENLLKGTKGSVAALIKYSEAQATANDAAKLGTERTEDLSESFKTMGRTLLQAKTGLGEYSKGFSSLAALGPKQRLLFDVGASMLVKMGEATSDAIKHTDDLVASLGSELGMMSEIGDITALHDLANQSDLASVTMTSLGENLADIQRETKGLFGNVLKLHPELGIFAGEMKKLGVSASTTGKLFLSLGHTLGEDIEKIKETERAVVEMARSFGVSADQVVEDFAKINDAFADMGEGSIEAAKNVERISLATKVSSDSIVNFTDKFALMDNAVTTANDLNMVFGKVVVSGTELNRMFYEDGRGEIYNKMLGTMIDNFDELNANTGAAVAKRRQLATAMGLTNAEMRDTMTAIREQGGAQATLDGVMDSTQAAAMEAAKYVTIQENLNKLHEQFGLLFGPMVSGINFLLGGLNKLFSAMPSGKKALMLVVFAVGSMWAATQKLKMSLISIKQEFLSAINPAAQFGQQATRTASDVTNAANRMSMTARGKEKWTQAGGMGIPFKGGGAMGRMGRSIKGGGGMMAAAGLGMDLMSMATQEESVSGEQIGSAVGGAVGTAALWALGAALAPFTGGASLAVSAMLSMAGGAGGSAIGGWMGSGRAFDDVVGRFPADGGAPEMIRINTRDDLKMSAAKPGGPIAETGQMEGATGALMGAAREEIHQSFTISIPELGLERLEAGTNKIRHKKQEIALAAG